MASATYDGSGRLASSGWAAATSYGYDPVGRLQSLSHNMEGTSADQTIGLAYNPAGQILSRTGSNDAYAWTGAVAANRPYSVNGQNQYTAAGDATFAHDLNGNLISTASPDGSTSFVYDVENRLVSATGEKSAALVYDPLGRLFQVSGGAAGITQFLYDDDALIGEYDSAGTMVHRYIHGTGKGVDDPLVWYNNPASGWRRALVSDQQGSIIAVADMYGNPIAINAYDEYGIPREAQTSAGALGTHGRFQYTGQAWIPELGMYYYKARIYSPTLGRFLQVDPIGYEGGINLYAYVENDPVNRVDPDGKTPVALLGLCAGPQATVCAVAGAVVVGVAVVASRIGSDRRVPASDRTVTSGDNGGPPLKDPVKVVTPTDTIADRQLSPKTLDAARRELRGEVVSRKPNGSPFDHVTKVRNAQQGLLNRIGQIKARLTHPRISMGERRALTSELSKASRKLDESKRYVP